MKKEARERKMVRTREVVPLELSLYRLQIQGDFCSSIIM